jgi:hypothetical protein
MACAVYCVKLLRPSSGEEWPFVSFRVNLLQLSPFKNEGSLLDLQKNVISQSSPSTLLP